jgi:hypothetical protein
MVEKRGGEGWRRKEKKREEKKREEKGHDKKARRG